VPTILLHNHFRITRNAAPQENCASLAFTSKWEQLVSKRCRIPTKTVMQDIGKDRTNQLLSVSAFTWSADCSLSTSNNLEHPRCQFNDLRTLRKQPF